MKISERLYRWLLRLYPREFRDEYGDEMSLVFRDRATGGSVFLWLQVIGDLFIHAPQEHWSTTKQDLRFAFRQIRRSPGFSGVVIVTLALGIGGTTAVFSVLQAVLLAPLPYEEPGQLVRFYQQEPEKPVTRHYLTAAHFKLLRDEASSFESVTAINNYRETGADLIRDGRAERVSGLRVSSDYFQTLRSPLLRGPGFERRDELGALRGSVVGAPRAVLSSELWRSAFRGDPSILGSTIRLSGEPFEVVGIASEGFEDPIVGKVDAWVPYDLMRDNNPENNSLSAVGRLKPGVTLEHAREELARLSRSMKERWPSARLSAVVAVPLHEDLVTAARGPLHLVFIAVGLVLLVACVNVANLVMARTMGRVNEFAVRLALGSGSRRIVRQMLVESLVLAGLGGVMGLAVATIAIRVLRVLGADALPRLKDVGFDPVVLGFAALVTLATAIAFGVGPALRLAHVSPVRALRQQSRSTSTRAQGRLRNVLAAAQLALALTLLIGAGVLLASFYRLQRVDLGFRVDNVLTFEVNLPSVRYSMERRVLFHEELARRLRAIPSVNAAGGISFLPATGSYHGWTTSIVSGPRAGASVATRDGFNIQQRTVSGDFFEALNIPLLAGRMFDAREDAGAPARAMVSANFARAAFPGMPFDSVIGQRIAIGDRSTLEIVGVVGDTTLDVYGTSSSSSITHIGSLRTTATGHSHRSWRPAFRRADSRGCARDRIGDGSRTGRVPASANDGSRRARHPPRAIRARADGSLRGHRCVAGRGRSLRCARVRGSPTHAGDWCEDRPWCDCGSYTSDGFPTGRPCARCRPHCGHVRCAVARTLVDVAHLRNQSVGSSNHSGGGGGSHDDRTACGVVALTARRSHRAEVRHAGRVAR